MPTDHGGQQDRPAGAGGRGLRVLRARRRRIVFHLGVARTRSRGAARSSRRAAARARRVRGRIAGFEARADRPSQRREIIAAESPVRIRARDRRRHARHDARSGGCATHIARPRRAVDRHGRNTQAAARRRRAGASLGWARDRNDSARERRAAGDRRKRGNHRPGRAAGAAGGHQRSRDGDRVQQVGRRGEAGAQGAGVRARRA